MGAYLESIVIYRILKSKRKRLHDAAETVFPQRIVRPRLLDSYSKRFHSFLSNLPYLSDSCQSELFLMAFQQFRYVQIQTTRLKSLTKHFSRNLKISINHEVSSPPNQAGTHKRYLQMQKLLSKKAISQISAQSAA